MITMHTVYVDCMLKMGLTICVTMDTYVPIPAIMCNTSNSYPIMPAATYKYA